MTESSTFLRTFLSRAHPPFTPTGQGALSVIAHRVLIYRLTSCLSLTLALPHSHFETARKLSSLSRSGFVIFGCVTPAFRKFGLPGTLNPPVERQHPVVSSKGPFLSSKPYDYNLTFSSLYPSEAHAYRSSLFDPHHQLETRTRCLRALL